MKNVFDMYLPRPPRNLQHYTTIDSLGGAAVVDIRQSSGMLFVQMQVPADWLRMPRSICSIVNE